MPITLADLVARLTADAPPQGGVPSDAQYAQAVKDAVRDLSRRASTVRTAPIAAIASQDSYALPADFVTLIALAPIGAPYAARGADTLITAAGLIPLPTSYRERAAIVGGQLLISPTPTANAIRTLVYAGGDALDDAGVSYPTLTEERAAVALLLARASCLERIASSPRGDAVRTEISQESAGSTVVDTRQRASELRATATSLRAQYQDAIADLNTGVGGLG